MTLAPRPTPTRCRNPTRATILLAVAAAAISGCGGERVYPVRLDVRLADGTPAAGCSVVVTRSEPPEVVAGGEIGADGSCMPVVSRGGGLPPGTYRVAVSANSGPPLDGSRKQSPFAERYGGHATSGLQFMVGPGQPRVVEFLLQR
jgi:hypothetical protein